ncbi:ATP-binding cassette (ABC) Superfamily, partial [Phytophthora palmivora]
MITGSESDVDSPGSTKDPTPSQDPPSQDAPSQNAPVDDTESSEAKAASTSSPDKNITLLEGKARAQAAKAASSKRADEGIGAAKKRAALETLCREPSFSKDYHSLFDSSSDDAKEERAVTEPQEISNDLDGQQERYQAAQLQGAPAPPKPVHPHGYYPRDAGSGSPMFLEHLKAPRGLNHGRTSRGAYERALVQDEPLFVNDIEAARCVLLAPHRILLKEFTSLRKKPEDRGGLFPVWGYPWVRPENTTTQTQAEDLFRRWVSLKNFTVQELQELREDRLLSYVLGQRDLRIEFAHLIAKRHLHSVMEGLIQQSKSSAQDERGYGSVNPGTVHREAAKKLRTTYSPIPDLNILRAVNLEPPHEFCDEGIKAATCVLLAPHRNPLKEFTSLKMSAGTVPSIQETYTVRRLRSCGLLTLRLLFKIPDLNILRAVNLEPPHEFCDEGALALPRTLPLLDDPLHMVVQLAVPIKEARRSSRTRLSTRFLLSLILVDPQLRVRQLRDRVYAIEIALGFGPGGQAAAPAGKPGTLEVLCQDLDALGPATHELHGRVDRRDPAAAVKELRRGLDVLSHE